MNMTLCSRCKKRIAVIFIARVEDGVKRQEGLCIKCAKDLGIKPINDMIEKMGVSDEDLERMAGDMEGLMESLPDDDSDSSDDEEGTDSSGDGKDGVDNDESPDSRAPAMDLGKLFDAAFRGMSDPSPRGEAVETSAADSPQKQGGEEKGKSREGASGHERKKKWRYLSTYCENLTDKAKQGKMDRIVGRERELSRVIQILSRRQKNNPCLIGEPGVGKTAIAEALAQKIADGDVPFKLRGSEIMLVDMTALVAGTQFRGQFESRILGLLNEVKQAGNIILVIDEVHTIVGAGDAEGSMSAANILKPALSRGDVQVIGSTTLTEYRKYIEKDSALERRFQPVMVGEPSVGDSELILKGIKKYYEEFHGVLIPDEIIHDAVSLSERYITERYLPDKAIDLLDEAAARVAAMSPVVNECLTLAKRETELKHEQEALESKISGGDTAEETYKAHSDVQVELLRTQEKLADLREQAKTVAVTANDLADVIEIWTGIPATSITANEYTSLADLEKRLSSRIIGQQEAVSAVARAVRRNRTGVSFKKKPVSFIFAGPTGVGKTELVKVLSQDLFSSPETLIRLDMSEFMDKFSVSRIIGAPPGYVGYDDAGQLTEKIRRRPYSVVLFDEIEKAHPDVMNILLQILDEGRVTDAQGRVVDFSNTILVMTTNAGSTYATAPVGFTYDSGRQAETKTEKALSEFLRPEFINRVDEIITFRSLSQEDFRSIASLQLGDVSKALSESHIRFTWTEAAAAFIAEKSFSVKYGARNMRRFIQTEVEDRIASEMIRLAGKVEAIELDVGEDGLLVSSI